MPIPKRPGHRLFNFVLSCCINVRRMYVKLKLKWLGVVNMWEKMILMEFWEGYRWKREGRVKFGWFLIVKYESVTIYWAMLGKINGCRVVSYERGQWLTCNFFYFLFQFAVLMISQLRSWNARIDQTVCWSERPWTTIILSCLCHRYVLTRWENKGL